MAAAASSSMMAVESTPLRPLATRSIASARAQRHTHTRRCAHTHVGKSLSGPYMHHARGARQQAGSRLRFTHPESTRAARGLSTDTQALSTRRSALQSAADDTCDGSHVVEVPLLSKLHCWRAYKACQ